MLTAEDARFCCAGESTNAYTDHGAATVDLPLANRLTSPLPCIGWFAALRVNGKRVRTEMQSESSPI